MDAAIGTLVAGSWIANAICIHAAETASKSESAIIQSGTLQARAIERGSSLIADAITSSNQEISLSILAGTSAIREGLYAIADAIQKQKELDELKYVESQIEASENFLYQQGALGRFYEECDLQKLYHHPVKPSYFSFLEFVTKGHFDTIAQLSKVNKCHPLFVLAYFIAHNGGLIVNQFFVSERNRNQLKYIGIGTTDYYLPVTNTCFTNSRFPKHYLDYIEYGNGKTLKFFHKDDSPIERVLECSASIQDGEAVPFLLSYADSYGDPPIAPEAVLKWQTFFKQLNGVIYRSNLDTLNAELRKFVRKIRIESEKKS